MAQTKSSDRPFMKAATGFVMALLCGTGAVLAAQDAAAGNVVPSTQANALPPPAEWRCDLIRPEYAAYLAAGNEAENWRYAGPLYRDVESGELYAWEDWLAWEETAGCAAAATPAISGRTAIGAAIAALGTGLLVSSNGANAKSPG